LRLVQVALLTFAMISMGLSDQMTYASSGSGAPRPAQAVSFATETFHARNLDSFDYTDPANCDSSFDGWHFIINGLGNLSAPASITVTFSDSPSEPVALDSTTGNANHYISYCPLPGGTIS